MAAEINEIGFIGLGNMGGRIARRISAAGWSGAGFDVDPTLAADAGLAVAGSISSLAPKADAVFFSLPDSSVVERVVYGNDGVLDVCREAHFLKEDCKWSGDAPAHPGETILTVHDLPPGTYAVQAFHDENQNKKVDRALFGTIPKEGIGFSRDAPIHMSPPKWADAEFAFDGAPQTITLRMRYMLGASGPGER